METSKSNYGKFHVCFRIFPLRLQEYGPESTSSTLSPLCPGLNVGKRSPIYPTCSLETKQKSTAGCRRVPEVDAQHLYQQADMLPYDVVVDTWVLGCHVVQYQGLPCCSSYRKVVIRMGIPVWCYRKGHVREHWICGAVENAGPVSI